MDSDSSLDGEFETKHEIAVKGQHDRETVGVLQNGSEEGSDDDLSSDVEENYDLPTTNADIGDNVIKSPDSCAVRSLSEDDKDELSLKSLESDYNNSSPAEKLITSPNIKDSSPIQSPPEVDRGIMSPQSHISSNVESPEAADTCPRSPNSGISSPLITDTQIKQGSISPKSEEEDDDDGELSDSSNDVGQSKKFPAFNEQNEQSVNYDKNVDLASNSGEAKESLGENIKLSSDERKVSKKDDIQGHAEDLSDVSDLDSNDGHDSLDAISDEDKKKIENKKEETLNVRKETAPVEEMEQLDFEAEEQQEKEDREEGECEGKDDKSDDEGELKGDDLEEGELTDEDENRPEETEPRPVCRFYNRGQCTWGSSCRFLHPGVTDKGNYTMFDMVRPLVPVNGPPLYPPTEYRAPYDKISVTVPYQGPRKDEAPIYESAWERGLRQAKEMMRKSTKRKETDMDFEEKKMNLSLGQEELDKENDYYTRPASPLLKEDSDRWGMKGEGDGKYHREGSVALDRFEDIPESPYYHQSRSSDYWRRVHYDAGEARALRVEAEYGSSRSSKYQQRSLPSDYYDKYEKKTSSRQKMAPTREVIVERIEKPWRDERYAEVSMSSHRGRGDEWADPWMRSKSPTGRKTGGSKWSSRRQSYTSGSSYTSSSSSRSSSQSSYSSYSHDSHSRSRSKSHSLSRSRSRSSSRTPLSRARRKTIRSLVPTSKAAADAPTSPTASPRKNTKALGDQRIIVKNNKPLSSTLIQSEKKAASERALLMNPPAPSPRKQKEVRPPSPAMKRMSAQNPPAPVPNTSSTTARVPAVPKVGVDRSKLVLAAAMSNKEKLRSRSRSSRSSSGSDSSGSSSDSSESSYSSSSSSREPSPKAVRQPKRIVMDERERLALTQSLKIKAMDALKLSGQKQQIKLTLKTPGSNVMAPAKRSATGLPELPELNLVRRDRMPTAVVAGRKRPADAMSAESVIAAKVAALSKQGSKKATSRREELLKQLKAVEDAIARKRSKI